MFKKETEEHGSMQAFNTSSLKKVEFIGAIWRLDMFGLVSIERKWSGGVVTLLTTKQES